jgi:hypothetical protein
VAGFSTIYSCIDVNEPIIYNNVTGAYLGDCGSIPQCQVQCSCVNFLTVGIDGGADYIDCNGDVISVTLSAGTSVYLCVDTNNPIGVYGGTGYKLEGDCSDPLCSGPFPTPTQTTTNTPTPTMTPTNTETPTPTPTITPTVSCSVPGGLFLNYALFEYSGVSFYSSFTETCEALTNFQIYGFTGVTGASWGILTYNSPLLVGDYIWRDPIIGTECIQLDDGYYIINTLTPPQYIISVSGSTVIDIPICPP